MARNTDAEIARKKRLAYTLYVENGFEQKVIAEITGISETSISKWKKEQDWEDDREEARMGFEQQRRRIRRHINTLLTNIEDRESPFNIPTTQEADTLNKLASAVEKLQTKLSFAHKSEVGKQFISFVQEKYGQAETITVTTYWHEWLMSTT